MFKLLRKYIYILQHVDRIVNDHIHVPQIDSRFCRRMTHLFNDSFKMPPVIRTSTVKQIIVSTNVFSQTLSIPIRLLSSCDITELSTMTLKRLHSESRDPGTFQPILFISFNKKQLASHFYWSTIKRNPLASNMLYL